MATAGINRADACQKAECPAHKDPSEKRKRTATKTRAAISKGQRLFRGPVGRVLCSPLGLTQIVAANTNCVSVQGTQRVREGLAAAGVEMAAHPTSRMSNVRSEEASEALGTTLFPSSPTLEPRVQCTSPHRLRSLQLPSGAKP